MENANSEIANASHVISVGEFKRKSTMANGMDKRIDAFVVIF